MVLVERVLVDPCPVDIMDDLGKCEYEHEYWLSNKVSFIYLELYYYLVLLQLFEMDFLNK